MNVRKKTVLITFVLFAIALIIIVAVSQTIILSGFENLEKADTVTQVGRANDALNREVSGLDTLVLNNAAWDDTYKFIQNNNTAYIIDNVNDQTFIAANLTFEVFINSLGQMVFEKTFPAHNISANMLYNEIWTQFPTDSNLWNLQNTDNFTTGIININGSLFILASRPILTNNYAGPVKGVLIMGRELSTYMLTSLEEQTHLQIQITALNQKDAPPNSNQLNLVKVKVENNSVVVGSQVLDDINGNPCSVMNVYLQRNIYQQGMGTVNTFTLMIIVSFLSFAGTSLFVLDKALLSRIFNVTKSVQEVTRKDNIGSRVTVKNSKWASKNDEISVLLLNINHMLDKIEEITCRLNKSERFSAIGQLAVMVAHDLRNPLQGINIATDFLSRENQDNLEKKKRMLELIKVDVRYCDKIISDLLDYSREPKINPTKTGVRSIVEAAFSNLKVPENIHVNNLAIDDLKINVDFLMIQRVFENLIKNAIDAMPNGGALTIKTEPIENNMCISIEDTGVGIPDDAMQKLFTPLYTTKAKGMGFGLAICKRIVEANKGIIDVKSVLGKGTKFLIELPL